MDPLIECLANRVTPEMFFGFLKDYMRYWFYVYDRNSLDETYLHQAETHAIQYAKEHGMHLVFKEMRFQLKPLQ